MRSGRKRSVALFVLASAGIGLLLYNYFDDVTLLRNIFQKEVTKDHAAYWTTDNSPVTSQSTLAKSGTTTFNSTPRLAPNVLVHVFPGWITSNPHDPVPTKRVYLYSAHVTLQQTPTTGTNVHIVAFQEKLVPPLTCCVRRAGHDVQTVPATVTHARDNPNNANDAKEVFALVYQCHLPFSSQELNATNVTVTSSSCPDIASQYLPILIPEVVPGGLAICGKTAFGSLLDPSKLVEWFEVQRALGVDKIQIFDLDNPEKVLKVFRHYQESGLLVLLPYKLPGKPWGRGFTDETRVLYQLGHDEDLPILECRLRLAGYEYIMGIDMDEFIMPRANTSLKSFIKDKFDQSPNTAAFFFHVQFFIEEWGPVDSNASMHILRFLNSTQARWECQKYVYMPARNGFASTHTVHPYQGFSTKIISPDLAVIHHYRKCPHGWKSCNPPKITDTSMHRFEKEVVPRVKDALSKTVIRT